jgi:cell division protein FtsL
MANRYKNGEQPKKQPGKVGRWLLIVLVLILELFVYTTVRLECMHARQEIGEAKAENDRLTSRTTALIVEKERLNSPERISDIAKSRLNMTMPSSDQVIYINFHEL